MINIFSHFFLFLIIIYSNGVFFLKQIKHLNNKKNFYEICLIGLIATIFVSQIINFIFPLNNYVIYLNLFFIFILFLNNKKDYLDNLKFDFKIFIPIFFLTLFNIYGSKFHDDINHYHYGYIINTDNFNYIWGLANLHYHYGYSSIWLIGHSYFNFDTSRLQDIHILNGVLFFLILSLFISEIISLNKKKSSLSIFIFTILIFILLKYTRLKEFGIDRPAFLIFYFFIYYYLKNFIYGNNSIKVNDIIILLSISLFIIFIKITLAIVIIIPFYLIIKFRKEIFKFDIKYLLILVLIISYFIKNILLSGCLIFPIDFLCFETIPWNNKLEAGPLFNISETLNKSWALYDGNLSQSEYINNFNWLETWFKRNKVELLEFCIPAILGVLISLLCYKNASIKNITNYNFKELRIILLSIIIFSLTLFFTLSPVIRMSHHIFVAIMILLISIFFYRKKIFVNKKITTFFLIILIFFNYSKNFLRIEKFNFINDPFKVISIYVEKPTKKKLDNFTYYIGFYGESPIGNMNLDKFKHKKKFIFNILFKK